ncbi:MAG: MarR family transcriptional regulator [Lachnospiraceae bacterium]|jgi:DNA-binding MarR family transcriptional regulator|nr:MarR family transcriptional regulator [Lachnospiraceae bacterium]
MTTEAMKLEYQLCFPLYAAARKIVNGYTPYFKPLGITYTQYIVLLVLWEQKTATVGELCHRLYLDNGTLTPLLKKMEEKGYLTRTRKAEDERVVQVTLTEEGLALQNEMVSIPEKVSKCVNLDPEEALTLYRLLYKILEE